MATEDDFTKRYDEKMIYLIRGSTLNKWIALIRRNRPKAGVGTTTSETSDGTVINAPGTGSTSTS